MEKEAEESRDGYERKFTREMHRWKRVERPRWKAEMRGKREVDRGGDSGGGGCSGGKDENRERKK